MCKILIKGKSNLDLEQQLSKAIVYSRREVEENMSQNTEKIIISNVLWHAKGSS